MNFSIFTPTHRPEHLLRCARSLAAQTILTTSDDEMEWVIVCNVACAKGEVEAMLPELPFAVRVIQAPAEMKGVGALKRFAAMHCNGEVLVELDHDDELLPDCLEEVGEYVGLGAGFVSSATLEIKADGGDVLYPESHGWLHQTMQHDGKTRTYNEPFQPSARALGQIYYAPNHVRAWTAEAYWKAGGHNASLAVADDQDLMIRTYLAGVIFAVCPVPLYVQHMHGGNTQKERNAEIQKAVARLFHANLYKLVAEECRRNKLPMFDLGGAHNSPDGFTVVDIRAGAGGITCDVTQGLPWADNSVGAIRAHDFLEHIPIGKVVPLMNEIHRVLAPGGWLLTSTPSTDGRGAFQDPTHCSFWNENSFWYYTRAAQAKYVPEITARFHAARLFTHEPSDWHRENKISYVVADLVAMKGQRCPGWNGFYQSSPTSTAVS